MSGHPDRDNAPAGVLVVAATEAEEARLRDTVASLIERRTAVRVVSPASKLSRLQWLANEEDEARAQAEATASEAAAAAEEEDAVVVEASAGDVDPIQAAEDALQTFRADEILVLVDPEEEESWLERAAVQDGFERFGLPVRYVVVGPGR